MYKLYFKPSHGRTRLLCTKKTEEAAEKQIGVFLKANGYKAPYYRMWETIFKSHKAKKIDVGSHTEFFYLVNWEDKVDEQQ